MEENQKEEYLGRFPSEAEYIRRIDDISTAIKNNDDAYMTVRNLLYDLPYPWLEQIEEDINMFTEEYKNNIRRSTTKSQRTNYSHEYALKVKQRVISFLYEVGMWSAKRRTAPEGTFSLYDEGEEEE